MLTVLVFAAPQIGILRRVVVIDIGEGLVELVNPEIIYEEGEQEMQEGCLSCPGVYGMTNGLQKSQSVCSKQKRRAFLNLKRKN